ncbi:hypothetical protein [Paraburkholderia sp. BL6665CI2N2]|uniref:hypothetical protein n=1 Tax=Paraburkholderia sp. BL6665CI2N2 TaxID=1938806 RepID=UPI001416F051|nr:hypothetical protein [Paraburkholderia sp. BL6665CI2N2]
MLKEQQYNAGGALRGVKLVKPFGENKKGLPVWQALNVVFDVSNRLDELGCGGRI